MYRYLAFQVQGARDVVAASASMASVCVCVCGGGGGILQSCAVFYANYLGKFL